MDLLYLSNFDRGLIKDYLCEVSSNLTKWFQRRLTLECTHARTHDGQPAMEIAPWPPDSGAKNGLPVNTGVPQIYIH